MRQDSSLFPILSAILQFVEPLDWNLVAGQETLALGRGLRQIEDMDLMNENFLWASMIWGAIGGGYLLYGWRQKSGIPLAGGAVMTAVSFLLPALPMTFACLAVMGIVYWLLKQGY